jgi:uncharacterized membrane protein YgaE (UPF0421/DUF939 family)
MKTATDWFQRAQWMLAGEIAGFVALSLLLGSLGFSTDWLFVALWLFNLATAVCFARAAAGMGKSPALHGVIAAVGPPGAILSWARLLSARVFGEPTGPME